ncbi:MAG: hypothetical protein GX624_06150 [Actinobacteria bacterium]|nr:hypothetical protein [Actinomycetota bacterium]
MSVIIHTHQPYARAASMERPITALVDETSSTTPSSGSSRCARGPRESDGAAA